MGENRNGPLSERELELLRLVATGATNQQIARELVISVNTVKVHLRNIFEKLNVESRTEATLVAIREGWVILEGIPTPAEDSRPEEPPPAPKRISLRQRVFLVVSAIIVFLVAFLPSFDSRHAQSQTRSPFTERSVPSSLLVPDEPISRWATMSSMLTPRGRLAAALYEGQIYAIGGDTDVGVTGVTEAFDITANQWSVLAAKPTPASNIAAGVIDGRIWVPGGFTADGSVTSAVEVFDIATGEWATGPALPRPMCAYALSVLDGDLYLFGGADDDGYLDTAYRLSGESGVWEELAPLSSPRAFSAAAVIDGKIYVAGGFDGQHELDACQVYDPAQEGEEDSPWSHCAPLMVGRGGLGLAAAGSSLYAIGGGWEQFLAYNEQFDPAQGRWTSLRSPVTGEWRNSAVVSDGQRIYVVGGWDGRYLDTVWVYQAIVTIFLPITP